MRHPYGSAAIRHDDAAATRTKRATVMMVRQKEKDRQAVHPGGSELFPGLTEEESLKVTRRMEEIRYLQGTAIFREGDPSDSLFALEEGLVKLVARSGKGAGTILYILRPGDIFGELLLVEERRPFNAVAVTDVLADVLSRKDFIRILSRRLASVEKGVTEFRHTKSSQRLAKILLQICGEHGEEAPGGVLLRPPLTHSDLADMIGTTRETVTTQLHRFHRMDLVWTHRRHLVVNRRRMIDYVQSGCNRSHGRGTGLEKSA